MRQKFNTGAGLGSMAGQKQTGFEGAKAKAKVTPKVASGAKVGSIAAKADVVKSDVTGKVYPRPKDDAGWLELEQKDLAEEQRLSSANLTNTVNQNVQGLFDNLPLSAGAGVSRMSFEKLNRVQNLPIWNMNDSPDQVIAKSQKMREMRQAFVSDVMSPLDQAASAILNRTPIGPLYDKIGISPSKAVGGAVGIFPQPYPEAVDPGEFLSSLRIATHPDSQLGQRAGAIGELWMDTGMPGLGKAIGGVGKLLKRTPEVPIAPEMAPGRAASVKALPARSEVEDVVSAGKQRLKDIEAQQGGLMRRDDALKRLERAKRGMSEVEPVAVGDSGRTVTTPQNTTSKGTPSYLTSEERKHIEAFRDIPDDGKGAREKAMLKHIETIVNKYKGNVDAGNEILERATNRLLKDPFEGATKPKDVMPKIKESTAPKLKVVDNKVKQEAVTPQEARATVKAPPPKTPVIAKTEPSQSAGASQLRILGKDELLKSDAPNFPHAIEKKIPISKIDGLDPSPADWVDDAGNTRQFKKGEPITKRIEVQYNPDTGNYTLFNGNHRVKQAILNGDTSINAFVHAQNRADYARLSSPKAETPVVKAEPKVDATPRVKVKEEVAPKVASGERSYYKLQGNGTHAAVEDAKPYKSPLAPNLDMYIHSEILGEGRARNKRIVISDARTGLQITTGGTKQSAEAGLQAIIEKRGEAGIQQVIDEKAAKYGETPGYSRPVTPEAQLKADLASARESGGPRPKPRGKGRSGAVYYPYEETAAYFKYAKAKGAQSWDAVKKLAMSEGYSLNDMAGWETDYNTWKTGAKVAVRSAKTKKEETPKVKTPGEKAAALVDKVEAGLTGLSTGTDVTMRALDTVQGMGRVAASTGESIIRAPISRIQARSNPLLAQEVWSPAKFKRALGGTGEFLKKEAGEVLSGLDATQLDKMGGVKTNSKLAKVLNLGGLSDVPARHVYYHMALDDFAGNIAKRTGGDRVAILNELRNGQIPKGVSEKEFSQILQAATEASLDGTFNNANVISKAINLTDKGIEQAARKSGTQGWGRVGSAGLRAFTRFSKVLTNVGLDAVNRTPLGVAEGAVRLNAAKNATVPLIAGRRAADITAKGVGGTLLAAAATQANPAWLGMKIIQPDKGQLRVEMPPAIEQLVQPLSGAVTVMKYKLIQDAFKQGAITDNQRDTLLMQSVYSMPSNVFATNLRNIADVTSGRDPGKKFSGVTTRFIPGAVKRASVIYDSMQYGKLDEEALFGQGRDVKTEGFIQGVQKATPAKVLLPTRPKKERYAPRVR